jgi:hypothetical protein
VRRREFITQLGGVAFAFPLAARAQQRTTAVIGYLTQPIVGADDEAADRGSLVTPVFSPITPQRSHVPIT